MGKFCGNTLPNAVISTGNTMKLEFVSDSSVTKRGFRVYYQVIGKYCATNVLCNYYYCVQLVQSTACCMLNCYFSKTSVTGTIGI